ncbi:MAG: methionyl-tRNA formyltransferase [Polyangiales bacterium]|jgi:methionyl-tRNA formyltransferase
MSRLRIFYCGVPLGAEVLRRGGFAPVGLAYGPLDLPGRRRLRRLLPESVHMDLPDLADASFQARISALKPDVLLSFFWPKRIPKEILALPTLGAFGTHPSLLPAYRGPDPYFWSLRNGDLETGVSLHRLEETYDTGGIVRQLSVPISPDTNAWDLAKALDRPAVELLLWAARSLSLGEELASKPQDEARVSLAPAPSSRDLRVDWKQSAESILRLVRAAGPEPGAQVLLADTPAELVRASLTTTPPPLGLRVAEAWNSPQGWAVRCKTGSVCLDEVRDLEGNPLNLRKLLEE